MAHARAMVTLETGDGKRSTTVIEVETIRSDVDPERAGRISLTITGTVVTKCDQMPEVEKC